jgi:hypothetical protein
MGKARAGSGKDKSKVTVVSKPNPKPGTSQTSSNSTVVENGTIPIEMTSTNLLKLLAASKNAHSKKQSANTQKNYKSKMGTIARFLYETHDPTNAKNDLRKYITRLSVFNADETLLLTEYKEVINEVETKCWLRVNVPLPKSAWQVIFGKLSTDPKLARGYQHDDPEALLNGELDANDIPTMSVATI